MYGLSKPEWALALVLLVGPCAFGQAEPSQSLSAPIATIQNSGLQLVTTGDLNRGLAIVASALDRRHRDRQRGDCSHLVNAIYKAAGLPYPYSKSSDLFHGISSFARID